MDTILTLMFAFIGIGFGIFMFLAPEDAISLETRWRYNRAEPSEKYIKLTRVEGIFLSLICAVFLVLMLFFPQS